MYKLVPSVAEVQGQKETLFTELVTQPVTGRSYSRAAVTLRNAYPSEPSNVTPAEMRRSNAERQRAYRERKKVKA